MPDSPTRPDEFAFRMIHAQESLNLSVDEGLGEPMPKRSDSIELSRISDDHEVQRGFYPKLASCAARSSGAGPSTVIPPWDHLCNVCPLGRPYITPHFDITEGGTFGGGDEPDGINRRIMQILLEQGDVEVSVPSSSPQGTAGIHQLMHTIKHIEYVWKLALRLKRLPVTSVGDSAQLLLDLRGKLKRQEIRNIDPAACSSNHNFPGKQDYAKSLYFLANDMLNTMADMRSAKLDTLSSPQDQMIYVCGNLETYQDFLNELLQELSTTALTGDVEISVTSSSPEGTAGIHQPMHTIKYFKYVWKLARRLERSPVTSVGNSAQMLLDLRGKLRNIDPGACSSNHNFPGNHYYAESLDFLANDMLNTMANMLAAKLDTLSNPQDQIIYVRGNLETYQDFLNELLQDYYRCMSVN